MSQLWLQVSMFGSSMLQMLSLSLLMQKNLQHKLIGFVQTKLPLHFARRNATWLLTQLAHLLQEDSPEQSGI